MKRKIQLSEVEHTAIIAALMVYELYDLANDVYNRFEQAEDPANDGPEVEILRYVS